MLCLVQILTKLHVSDYHNFWNNERDNNNNNNSPLNNCFSKRNVLQIASTLFKIGLKWLGFVLFCFVLFLSKILEFCTFLDHTNWFDFCQHLVQKRIKLMYGETLDFHWRGFRLAFATVARKSFNGKFTAKIVFF